MDSRKSGLWKGRLNDDGILSELYNYTWLVLEGVANGSITPPQPPAFSIPDTILYERGFPKAWYSWENSGAGGERESSLRKHLGKDISIATILKKFSANPNVADTVVAEYITLEQQSNRHPVHIEYLTLQGLASFLAGRAPGSVGILQRFVPTSSMYNTVYQFTWSPAATSIAQARSAVPISNTSRTITERYATFDADVERFQPVKIPQSSHARDRLGTAATSLTQMLHLTEGMPMLGVVFYAKVDVRGHVLILFATSLRSRTIESTNGTRDPMEVGANFFEGAASTGRASTIPLPPAKPKNTMDNMRLLPTSAKVRVAAGGRTSPVILGQAYLPRSTEAPLEQATKSDDKNWDTAIARLQALKTVVTVNVGGDTADTAKQPSPRKSVVTNASLMPDDHHKEERQTLLLFLNDMSYLTRFYRDRSFGSHHKSAPTRSSVVASNEENPSYFNQGSSFHFRIPPPLARALGVSGLAMLCRQLSWTQTEQLSDAHGHISDYYTFPWRAQVSTNEELRGAVMAVYPPVVLRKGRRSLAAKTDTRNTVAATYSDGEDDDDDAGLSDPGLAAILRSVTPRPQGLMDTPNASDKPSLPSPLMPAALLESPGTNKDSAALGALERASELSPNRWRMVSSFPTLNRPHSARHARQPLSCEQREAQTKLSASRKRLYYPEGQQRKPGPSIYVAGPKPPPSPRSASPLAENAARYAKTRNHPTPDAPQRAAPFQSDASTERKPMDLMMQFWTQT